MNRASRFIRKIGACPRCMRESFLAAAISWGICAAIGLAGMSFATQAVAIAALTAATALTLLWLLHLIVFAARSARSVRRQGARGGVALLTSIAPSRRAFLVKFASAFVVAALATSIAQRRAFAAQWYLCGGSSCGGNACCPASHPILNHCDCKCYQQSSDFNNCGSYNQCALDGSNCS